MRGLSSWAVDGRLSTRQDRVRGSADSATDALPNAITVGVADAHPNTESDAQSDAESDAESDARTDSSTNNGTDTGSYGFTNPASHTGKATTCCMSSTS